MGGIDLEQPLVPDLPEALADEYGWPESGPSSPPTKPPAPRLYPKAVAAMTGAMATSLLMTPFDVLKTRLQTIQPHLRPEFIPPPVECCQTPVVGITSVSCATSNLPGATRVKPSPAVAFAPVGCYHPSKWAGIWGEAISFEEVMNRGGILRSDGALALNRAPAETAPNGFWSEIAAVRREAGLRGLWKGVGTTLTMSIPSSAIYMIGYEYLLREISPIFTDRASAAVLTPAPLIAGALARTFSASVISPIEMFRTRLQALPSPDRPSPTYSSTGRDMAALVREKGITILWRGLGPTLWRDVPFSGIYWAGFELIKVRLNSAQSPLPPLTPVLTSFISGAVSGTFSALVTQPFDVLKTRRQVFDPSKNCSPEALKHRASTIPLALHVIRTEGWGALFAGVVPRCAKVAPACGLMIACYEGVGRYLDGKP